MKYGWSTGFAGPSGQAAGRVDTVIVGMGGR